MLQTKQVLFLLYVINLQTFKENNCIFPKSPLFKVEYSHYLSKLPALLLEPSTSWSHLFEWTLICTLLFKWWCQAVFWLTMIAAGSLLPLICVLAVVLIERVPCFPIYKNILKMYLWLIKYVLVGTGIYTIILA